MQTSADAPPLPGADESAAAAQQKQQPEPASETELAELYGSLARATMKASIELWEADSDAARKDLKAQSITYEMKLEAARKAAKVELQQGKKNLEQQVRGEVQTQL